jgi:hypothetical protein
MADKIDLAFVQLAREHPLKGFEQGGVVATQVTSTMCAGEIVHIPIISEQAAMPLLHASAAAAYTALESSTYHLQKERYGHLADMYGRSVSTIKDWLSSFRRSE